MASSLGTRRRGWRGVTGTDYIFVLQLLILVPIAFFVFVPVIVLDIDLQMHRVAVALASQVALLLRSKKCRPDVFAGHPLPLEIGTSAGDVNRILLPVQVDFVRIGPDDHCLQALSCSR